jgi:hypothetical protein
MYSSKWINEMNMDGMKEDNEGLNIKKQNSRAYFYAHTA